MKKRNGIFNYTLFIVAVSLIFVGSCTKNDAVTIPPVLITTNTTNITQVTAMSGGSITSDGGAPVTARGVCWSTGATPTIANYKTTDGDGTGNFTSYIIGLTASTTYYVRAYATNSAGIGYGNEISFKTDAGQVGPVTDIDGNVYNTVTIGTQVWMVENLKVTKYRDGTPIPLVTDNATWSSLITPGYCWYNNDETTYKNTYGALYNWYTVNTGKLSPTGWHVATREEWTTLTDNFGFDVNKLKATGAAYWDVSGGTNESGFSALPGGMRFNDGEFANVGNVGLWWSSTPVLGYGAWNFMLFDVLGAGVGSSSGNEVPGYSVRCIQD